MIPITIFGALSIDVAPVIIAGIVGLFVKNPGRAVIYGTLIGLSFMFFTAAAHWPTLSWAPRADEILEAANMLPSERIAYFITRTVITTVSAAIVAWLAATVRHSVKTG